MTIQRLHVLIRSRLFKAIVIVLLVILALWLKGERFTVAGLIARIADLIADLTSERVIHIDE